MYVSKADLEAGATGARGLSQWLTAARRHVPLAGPEQPKQISLLGVNIGGESRGSLEVEDVVALVNLAETKRWASATSVHDYRRALAGASGMVHSMYLPVSSPQGKIDSHLAVDGGSCCLARQSGSGNLGVWMASFAARSYPTAATLSSVASCNQTEMRGLFQSFRVQSGIGIRITQISNAGVQCFLWRSTPEQQRRFVTLDLPCVGLHGSSVKPSQTRSDRYPVFLL